MTDKEILKALECCNAEYNECEKCPFKNKVYCERHIIENAFDLINRQQAEIEICAETIKRQDKEIERLKRENKILSKNADNAFQDGLNEAQDLYAEQVKNEVRAEAIRDFAEAFDDILAGMRDEYAHFGRPEYGLVCEVVHAKLSNCVKKVVGKKYEY